QARRPGGEGLGRNEHAVRPKRPTLRGAGLPPADDSGGPRYRLNTPMRTSSLLRFPRHGIAAWLLLAAATANAQTAPDTYLVGFTDKASTPYALDRPEEFLSPRAI